MLVDYYPTRYHSNTRAELFWRGLNDFPGRSILCGHRWAIGPTNTRLALCFGAGLVCTSTFVYVGCIVSTGISSSSRYRFSFCSFTVLVLTRATPLLSSRSASSGLPLPSCCLSAWPSGLLGCLPFPLFVCRSSCPLLLLVAIVHTSIGASLCHVLSCLSFFLLLCCPSSSCTFSVFLSLPLRSVAQTPHVRTSPTPSAQLLPMIGRLCFALRGRF